MCSMHIPVITRRTNFPIRLREGDVLPGEGTARLASDTLNSLSCAQQAITLSALTLYIHRMGYPIGNFSGIMRSSA